MIEAFYQPRTIQEALSLKRKFKDRALYLAGGTLVNSKGFPLDHEHMISLAGIKDLGQGRISNKKGEVRIGALCTLEEVRHSKLVPECLKAALRQVVSRNIRNAATLGGHVAAGQAASDLIPMLIALEAALEICKPSARIMSLEEYLEDRPEGLIAEIILPKAHQSRVHSVSNLRLSANSRSTLSVAVSMEVDGGVVCDPIIVLGGVGCKITRLAGLEDKLHGSPMPQIDELEQLARKHAPRLSACVGASGEYLQYQSGVLVARALQEGCHQKGGCA